MPAWLLPAIGMAVNAASQAVGLGESRRAARKQQEWATQRYNIERQDALADWNMMNEYNSPKAQMQRFRDAGLNESLIYGQGTAGESSMPRSTQAQQAKVEAYRPETGGLNDSLMAFIDVRMKEAQIDNLEASNSLIRQNTAKAWADTELKARGIDKANIELAGAEVDDKGFIKGKSLYQSLKEFQLEAMRANIEKAMASTKYTLNEDERKAAANAMNLREAVERIANIRSRTGLTESQKKMLDTDLELKKKWNLSPNDPLYIRLLPVILQKLGF